MAETDTVYELEKLPGRDVYRINESSETLTSEYRMTEFDLDEPLRKGKVKVKLGEIEAEAEVFYQDGGQRPWLTMEGLATLEAKEAEAQRG